MEWDSTRPRWEQIRDVLVGRIADGTYAVGDRVPSVVDLQSEFGVASTTANKALRALRADGWTRTQPGMGSFVTGQPDTSADS